MANMQIAHNDAISITLASTKSTTTGSNCTYRQSRPILPTTPFLPSADPGNSNREDIPVPLCSSPSPPMKHTSPSCEAYLTGGSSNSIRRLFVIE